MVKIIYFSPNESSFVRMDLKELQKHFEVIHFVFEMEKKYIIPYYLLKQLFFILIYHRKASFYISRFAGYHSFIPSVLGKFLKIKHFIILCGVDCNVFPTLGYGYGLKPFLSTITSLSMKLAYMLLPVSKNLVASTFTYDANLPAKLGYENTYTGIKTRHKVVQEGIDFTLFRIKKMDRDEFSFVTISSGLESKTRRLIKGIDIFVKCAEQFPEYNFTIIGGAKPDEIPLLQNLYFIPSISNSELPSLLNKFGFYMQLSLSEGFAIALLEAMACGCIPIVSDVGIMPEIAGNYGYVLKSKDISLLRAIVEKAVNESDSINRNIMSEYIAENFSIQKRSSILFELLIDSE
jgi:glycosyltransferase involved in cell wall biosynthesis